MRRKRMRRNKSKRRKRQRTKKVKRRLASRQKGGIGIGSLLDFNQPLRSHTGSALLTALKGIAKTYGRMGLAMHKSYMRHKSKQK